MPAFEAFARKSGLESPLRREMGWKSTYQAANSDVFEAFDKTVPMSEGGVQALIKELSSVRTRVREATPVMREIVEELDPKLPELLGLPPEPAPLHVLMVGGFATNSAVGRLGDDVAVFHCLEWFQTAEGQRVLTAHETTHAWHELALGTKPPEDDAAWVAFAEGLAIAASREIVPGQPELDYFWYGHGEVENWLGWCEEHRQQLLEHFRASIDAPDTVETYFGGGMIDGQWRVGFYLADQLVRSLNLSIAELATLTVEQGQAAIREELGVEPVEPRPGPH
jgi:hypothetical protein